MSSEWIKIALLMKFELSDTHNIKIKNEDDPKKCWTEIFERWLLAGRKWENLLPILEEVLDSGTFESIKKAYAGPGMYIKLLVHCMYVLVYAYAYAYFH